MYRTIILFVLFCQVSFAQTHHVFELGHSLVNHEMPAMLQSICDDASGVNHSYGLGIINGAPLFWHWDHSDECEGYQATTIDSKIELASGNYDIFIMTEGVPWDPILSEFYAYADSFYSAALDGNPDIQLYLYETWNCINTGLPAGCMYDDGDDILWRDRIVQDLPTWESVADSLTVLHPESKEVYIIPAGQAYARLKDSIDAGVVPTVTDIYTSFFDDDIHSNINGKYFNALVHYSCIYKQSPVGLTNETTSQWGVSFPNIDPDLAHKLQEIAWHTVSNYPKSGILGTPPSPDASEECEFANDNSIIETQGNLCVDGAVNISDVLTLKPRDTPPSNPTKGTLYFDNNDDILKVFDGTSWRSLW